MPQKLIDLDVMVSEDLKVKVNGETYAFPGDAPTEQILRVSALIERQEKVAAEMAAGEGEPLTVEQLLEMRAEIAAELEALFRLRNPDLEEGSIELTDRQAGGLVAELFAYYYGFEGEGEGDEGDGDRPTGSKGSTRPRPRSSARSRPKSRAKGRKASGSSTS